VGAELFHADGCTDITKLIVAFRNFANAPKNVSDYKLLRNELLVNSYGIIRTRCVKPYIY